MHTSGLWPFNNNLHACLHLPTKMLLNIKSVIKINFPNKNIHHNQLISIVSIAKHLLKSLQIMAGIDFFVINLQSCF